MSRKQKRPNPHNLPPDFRSRQEDTLLRRNRVTVLLNDREMDALKRYQSILKDKSRTSICRDAIMQKVLSALEENSPTLF